MTGLLEPTTEHVDASTAPADSPSQVTVLSDTTSQSEPQQQTFDQIATKVAGDQATSPQAGAVSQPSQGITAPAAAPVGSLDPALVAHLQERWGFGQDQVSRFQTPQQLTDYAFQAAWDVDHRSKQQIAELQNQIAHLQSQQTQQKPQVQSAPTPQQPQPGDWNPPEFDPEWNKLVQRNPQTGLYESRFPGAVSPDIVTKANNHAIFQQKWQNELANNPKAFFQKFVDKDSMRKEFLEEAKKEILGELQQQQQQSQHAQRVWGILNKNAEWMTQRDAQGNELFDAQGHPLRTQQGQQYTSILIEMNNDPDYRNLPPEKQNEIALMAMQARGVQQQQVTPASRAQNYVNGHAHDAAMHTQSRNGAGIPSVPGAAVPQTNNSFMALATPKLSEMGFTGSYDNIRQL